MRRRASKFPSVVAAHNIATQQAAYEVYIRAKRGELVNVVFAARYLEHGSPPSTEFYAPNLSQKGDETVTLASMLAAHLVQLRLDATVFG